MIRGMEMVPGFPDGPVVLVHEHLTGGGVAEEAIPSTWLAEGAAMRVALARDFAAARARVMMTLDTRLAYEDGPWTIERIGPGSAAHVLPALVRGADFTIAIAPETRGILGDLAATIARAGGRSLGSLPEAIGLAADKLRLSAHLMEAGIETPTSIRVEPRLGLPTDAVYPAVLKPIDGAGCLNTLQVDAPDDPIVSTFPEEVGLLQPLVHGEARSASFLARPGRPPLLLGVGLQAMTMVGGRLIYKGGTILRDDLPGDHPARRAVASVPGLSGLVGVDYIHDPLTSDAVVIEVNPRPTTSCVGLIASLDPGRLARAWLELAGGGEWPHWSRLGLPTRSITFGADGSIFHDDRSPTSGSFRQ
jgi:predicted ATP-grasp superfamily ATP-dependent carboligase